MYRVVLWGLGEGYNVFTYLHGHEQVDIVEATDRDCLAGYEIWNCSLKNFAVKNF